MIKEKGRRALAGRQAAKKQHQEQESLFRLRAPQPKTLFELFRDELPDDQKPFARKLFQMDCLHADEEKTVVFARSVEQTDIVWLTCPRCELTRRWAGTEPRTKKAEWMTYCPEGFDMFDWESLYDTDKSEWRDIWDECEYTLLAETMEEGE